MLSHTGHASATRCVPLYKALRRVECYVFVCVGRWSGRCNGAETSHVHHSLVSSQWMENTGLA